MKNPPTPSTGHDQIDEINRQAHALRHADTRQALALSREAAKISYQLDYQFGLANSLYLSALCHFILGENDELLEQAFQARALFQSINDRSGLAQADNLIANIYHRQGLLENAMEHHQRSLQTRKENLDISGQSGSLNNIALLLKEQELYAEAIETLTESIALAEKSNIPEDMAYPLCNLGEVLVENSQFNEALDYFQRALPLVQNSSDKALLSTVLSNIGQVHAKLGNLEEAIKNFSESLVLCEQTGNLEDKALTLLGLGNTYSLVENFAEAGKILRQALEIMDQLQDKYGIVKTLYALANLQYKQKQYEVVVTLLIQALEIAENIKASSLIAQIYRLLSHTYVRLSNFEQAFKHYRAYHHSTREKSNKTSHSHSLFANSELAKAKQETESERNRSAQLSQALKDAQILDAQKEKLLTQLETQAKMLQQLAREDGLTGIANRRWLDLQLLREYERAQRFGHPLSIAMLDIDDFKKVNDTYSHLTGDKVLRNIAQLLQGRIRSVDIAGRYGGEEFMLILLETNNKQAEKVCEAIRAEIESTSWRKIDPRINTITISIGIATLNGHANLEDFVAQADAQLYKAKQLGKNKVCAIC